VEAMSNTPRGRSNRTTEIKNLLHSPSEEIENEFSLRSPVMSLGSAIGKHLKSGYIESAGITKTGSRNSALNNPSMLSGGVNDQKPQSVLQVRLSTKGNKSVQGGYI